MHELSPPLSPQKSTKVPCAHRASLCSSVYLLLLLRRGGFTANLKQDCSLLLVNTISSSLHYSATFILFLSLSLSFSVKKKKENLVYSHIQILHQEHQTRTLLGVLHTRSTPSVGILWVFAWLRVCFYLIWTGALRKLLHTVKLRRDWQIVQTQRVLG